MAKAQRHPARTSCTALAALVLAAAGCSGGSSSTPAALQSAAVTIAPTSATVAPNRQQLFAAAVTGTADTSVTWQVSQGCGSVTSAGLYTAPATTTTCQVVVTSNADTTKSATAIVTVQNAPPPPAAGDTAWAPLKIGAGGFITGIDIDPTAATYVIRTDTYGAYVGDGIGPWTQIVNSTSIPAITIQGFLASDTPWLSEGVYEIRVAPSNPNRLYMTYVKALWRSDDRGTTWMQASTGYVAGSIDPNDPTYRTWGQKMAVDPANADVVYAGAAGGLYGTANGGASWTLVPGVPASTTTANGFSAAMTGVAFDPSSGTTSGRTNTVYAVSNGNGVYRSIDAGASWSLLAGGPTTAINAAVSTDGVYYVVDQGNVFWRYQNGAWTQRNPGNWAVSVTADPFNAARVVAGRGSGHLSISNDHGDTWTDWRWSMTSTATDIPWMQNANGINSKATAMHVFDPVTPNRVWLADGIGVWRADPTTSTTAWISVSAGVEQLVGRDVLVPPGSSYVFTAGMDRAIFRTARDNQSYPAADITMGSTATLIGAWALDYSKLNPQHIVAIVNGQWGGDISGYSLDGGTTWTVFPAQPASGTSGDIMAPSIDNIVAIIGVNGCAYRSTNRGVSWTQLPGVPCGLHGGYSVKKHVLAVDGGYDGVTNRTLYLYAAGSGTWRSTDDGASWAQVSTFRTVGDYWHVRLRSVPGYPGHLFLATGNQGGTGQSNPHQGTALFRSTDGGATWTTVAGTGEPYDVAVGMALPGQSYPAIYFAGWYNNVWGIWRSTDNTASWMQIGPFPAGSLDHINRIAASADMYGEVYVAFNGSGWAKGNLR